MTLAKELGATATLLIKPGVSEKDNIKKMHELFGLQPEITIDASGAEASIRLAILVS